MFVPRQCVRRELDVQRTNHQIGVGEMHTRRAIILGAEMQAARLNWNSASLWVLIVSCYMTIDGMLVFLATRVWPVWLTGALAFTFVIGAPSLILRIVIGHRTGFRFGSTPMQAVVAGVAAFFYLGLVAFFVADL